MLHHEKWDGSGYPQGLSGNTIPLSARVVALADVYDALSVERCYKQPIPHEKCVEIIRGEGGKHFDPAIVEVFLQIESEFDRIRSTYAEKAYITPGTWPPGRQREVSHQIETTEDDNALRLSSAMEETVSEVSPLVITA